jgi:hypothetical protein
MNSGRRKVKIIVQVHYYDLVSAEVNRYEVDSYQEDLVAEAVVVA